VLGKCRPVRTSVHPRRRGMNMH